MLNLLFNFNDVREVFNVLPLGMIFAALLKFFLSLMDGNLGHVVSLYCDGDMILPFVS